MKFNKGDRVYAQSLGRKVYGSVQSFGKTNYYTIEWESGKGLLSLLDGEALTICLKTRRAKILNELLN